jgi:hypothetical protein
MLYVNVTEYFFEMDTLNGYIRKNHTNMSLEQWKCIVFQILNTYHNILQKYPNFRHNKLNTHTILIGIDNHKKTNEYIVDKIKFKFSNIPQKIKINYFDEAVLSENFKNNDANIIHKTPFYDIVECIYEISDLLNELHFTNIDVINFLNSIVPSKNKGMTEDEFMQNTQIIPTPTYILTKNNFFTDFIIDKMENTENDSDRVVPDSDDIETTTEDDVEHRNIAEKKSKKNKTNKKTKNSKKDEDDDVDELDQIDVYDDVDEENEVKKKDDHNEDEFSPTSDESDADSVSSGGDIKSIKKSVSESLENIARAPERTINAMDAFFNPNKMRSNVVDQPIQVPEGIDPAQLSQKINGTIEQQPNPNAQFPMAQQMQAMPTLGSAAGLPNMPGIPQRMVEQNVLGNMQQQMPMLPQQMPLPMLPQQMQQMAMPQQMPMQQMPPQMPIDNFSMVGNVPTLGQQQTQMGLPQNVPVMMGGKKHKHYKLVDASGKRFFF